MAEHSEQAKPKGDPVTISIGEMLDFSQNSPDQPCISKVPSYLRQVNEKAYEPLVISIGPYHRGKAHLQPMEQQKIRFLQKLLEERQSNDVSEYVMKMRELQDEARKCYSEPVSDLNPDDFVKVLLLDGVFIVQIIRLYLKEFPGYLKDMVDCYSDGFFLALSQDMLLVENQLPFFVLRELFCMIESSADEEVLKEAIFEMLLDMMPGKECPRDELKSSRLEIKHLLDFTYHCCYHPSTSEKRAYGENQNVRLDFIRCATELQEAGIQFELFEGNSMFDIRFENGTLCIPKIEIGDYTEPFLRNLIAYEQMFQANRETFMHATDYMIFMDSLVNSPKDVEILCQKGIIANQLGDDKALATMLNSLGTFVVYCDNFYYAEVFEKVNRHCSRPWNRWMANLKHNYFYSPWALISVLAAALLLLLAVVQTVVSFLSLNESPSYNVFFY